MGCDRFHDDESPAFFDGGKDEGIGEAVQGWHVWVVDDAGEDEAIF